MSQEDKHRLKEYQRNYREPRRSALFFHFAFFYIV